MSSSRAKGLIYELKKIGNLLTSESVGTGPSSYERRIYRAAVSRKLRNINIILYNEHQHNHFIIEGNTRSGITLNNKVIMLMFII